MPSVFTKRSSSRFLNQDVAIAELRTCAERLKAECEAVKAVHLFGSLAAGTATPRSDADILVEVTDDTKASTTVEDSARRAFSDAPLPVDLFVRSSRALASRNGIAGALKRHRIQLA